MATCLAVRQVFDRRSGKAACDATDFWVHSLSLRPNWPAALPKP